MAVSILALCCALAAAFWIYHSGRSAPPLDVDRLAQKSPAPSAPVSLSAPDVEFEKPPTHTASSDSEPTPPADGVHASSAIPPVPKGYTLVGDEPPTAISERISAPSAGARKRATPSDAKAAQRLYRPREDAGVDIAISVRGQIPLMDRPNADALRILTISERDILALLNREATDGWLNVIHVRSGKEGWVNRDDVHITLTKHPSPPPVFSEENVGTDADPEVNVLNKTNRELTLKIGETHYTVRAGDSLKVSHSAGTWRFYASAPGVIPDFGTEDWGRGHRYEWTFWVETIVVPVP
jgi:hypothetical protein